MSKRGDSKKKKHKKEEERETGREGGTRGREGVRKRWRHTTAESFPLCSPPFRCALHRPRPLNTHRHDRSVRPAAILPPPLPMRDGGDARARTKPTTNTHFIFSLRIGYLCSCLQKEKSRRDRASFVLVTRPPPHTHTPRSLPCSRMHRHASGPFLPHAPHHTPAEKPASEETRRLAKKGNRMGASSSANSTRVRLTRGVRLRKLAVQRHGCHGRLLRRLLL